MVNVKYKIGRELLYGLGPCHAAILAARRTIHKVLLHEKFIKEAPKRGAYREIMSVCAEKGMNVQFTDTNNLNRIVKGHHKRSHSHQNILLETSKLDFAGKITSFDAKEYNPGNPPLWVVINKIQDPMNLGAVIRSAVYFGVDRMVAQKAETCPLTPVVSKASAGAMEWMPVFNVYSIPTFLSQQLQKGWRVLGTVSDNDSLISDAKCQQVSELSLDQPTVLVIGNEGFGLDDEITSLCSNFLTIPSVTDLPPGLDSLNVSVATGVMLHSLAGHRRATRLGDSLMAEREIRQPPVIVDKDNVDDMPSMRQQRAVNVD